MQGADEGSDLTPHCGQSLSRAMSGSLFADGLASPKVLGVRTSKLQSTMCTTSYGYRGLKLRGRGWTWLVGLKAVPRRRWEGIRLRLRGAGQSLRTEERLLLRESQRG